MNYPRKYWWVVLVTVPIVVALIAIVANLVGGFGGGGDTFNVAGTQFVNSTVVIAQAQELFGQELPESVVETLNQAMVSVQTGDFDAAIRLLESVEEQAPVTALYSNLGAAYLASGDKEQAISYFARAPDEKTTQYNLAQIDSTIRVPSQIPGISAELVEFSMFQNTITVKLRFINSGEEDQRFHPTGQGMNSYLLDESTDERYQMTARSNDVITVPAGGSVEYWTKYPLPEGERPQYLTAVFMDGLLFEHIKAP